MKPPLLAFESTETRFEENPMMMTNTFRALRAPFNVPGRAGLLGIASTFLALACQFETGEPNLEGDEDTLGTIASAATVSNLALNKPATGSTPCAATEGASKAFNGSVGGGWADKWCSGATSLWLAVDLGATSQLSRFVVKHAGAGGEDATGNTRDFTIQISNDGVNYTTVVSVLGNSASITTHDISPVSARYVRLTISKPTSNTDIHARVYDFEVYGAVAGGGTGGSGGSGGTGGTTTGGKGGTGGTATGGTGGTATGGTGGTATGGTGGTWQLAWADEFNGSGLPNTNDWTYEVGRVRNQEAQYYTANNLNNARQESGNLVIEARYEPMAGAAYTSASLTTQNRHQFQYGRIEVRAKLPGGVGTWPAIWLLGTNVNQVGWPTCGEIDIMENVGFEPNIVHMTIHTSADQNGSHNSLLNLDQPSNRFYVYALDWTPQRLDFYVDATKAFSFANDGTGSASWPFSKPSFLLLNLAVGGSWGGQQGIDATKFPRRFYIDYVRYYTAR
jgi:hypothetical protein